MSSPVKYIYKKMKFKLGKTYQVKMMIFDKIQIHEGGENMKGYVIIPVYIL